MARLPGSSSWHRVRDWARTRNGWSWAVPVTAVVAGIIFTTSSTTAQGTALREDRRPQLVELINKNKQQTAQTDATWSRLRDEVEAQTEALAGTDAPIADEQRRAAGQRTAAGLVAMHGPGLTVRLDDAPRLAGGARPNGASVDDLVVHQQDVQAVVNALWLGGAEAMSIMDVRVISTSAVRCVGNTLLLHGQAYGPPFTITAIGDPDALRRALDAADGVRLFQEAAAAYGLGYRVTVEQDVTVPGYAGSTALSHATVPR